MAEDSDAAEVEGGVAIGELLQDGYVVTDTAVSQVAIAEIAERLRPPGHAQAVGHDDHEPKLRQRPLAETAYNRFKRAIVRCDLEPGQQVTKEQLAGRFA